MAWYPYQSSFAAGEISPRLYGEVPSQFYKNGVEFSENFLHLPQGPVRYRNGSEYLTDSAVTAPNVNVRLIPFNVLGTISNTDLCLELTAGEARLLENNPNGAVVQLSSVGQSLLNNDFALGSANWATGGGTYISFDWVGSQAYVDMQVPMWTSDWDPSGGGPLHPPHPPPTQQPRIEQKISVPAGPYRFQVGFPPSAGKVVDGVDASGIGVDVLIGTSSGASDIYLSTNNYNNAIDTTVTVPGVGTIDVYVRFRMTTAEFPADGAFVSRVYFPRFTGASSGAAVVTGLPWTDAMLPGIQFAQDIFYGMVLVHPLMHPQRVVYTGAAFTVAPVPFTSPPADWVSNNYPSTVDMWQARLWLGNTPDRPTTMWASTVNDYNDFSIPGTPTAESSIVLTLATKGAIKWIRGKQSLLIGTEFHEDVVVSATQVVSSLDAQLIRQSAYGSAPVQAQDIGDQVLFISRDQVKLRALNFNFDTQAWMAHDISYYAQGITLPGVIDVAFVRDPDNTIFVLCTDGTLRMCTYDRAQQVIAWSRWRTVGSVKAICATIDPTGTTLWLAVNRSGKTFIETIQPFTSQAPIYLDSYNSSVPTVYTPVGETRNRISIPCGTHLEGFTVGVFVDNAYLGFGVVSSGIVDLPYDGVSATTAIVGLNYTGTLRTLPLEGGIMYGSSQGQLKKRTKVFLRLLPGSYVPLINGQRAASRYPVTPLGTTSPIPPEDWDWWVTNSDGWDKYARVTITQDQPFQCEIASIFGRSETQEN